MNIVSVVSAGGRIARVEKTAGVRTPCQGGAGFLLGILGRFHLVYYQSHLNKIWALHGNQPEGTNI